MTAVNVAFGAGERYSVEEALQLVHKDVTGSHCIRAMAAVAAVCNDAEFEIKGGDSSSGPPKINGDATGTFLSVRNYMIQ
jgi:sodium/potassium-transporting ATPase subunit alpha